MWVLRGRVNASPRSSAHNAVRLESLTRESFCVTRAWQERTSFGKVKDHFRGNQNFRTWLQMCWGKKANDLSDQLESKWGVEVKGGGVSRYPLGNPKCVFCSAGRWPPRAFLLSLSGENVRCYGLRLSSFWDPCGAENPKELRSRQGSLCRLSPTISVS